MQGVARLSRDRGCDFEPSMHALVAWRGVCAVSGTWRRNGVVGSVQSSRMRVGVGGDG